MILKNSAAADKPKVEPARVAPKEVVPDLVVTRRVEDPSVMLKREEMKVHLSWLGKVQSQQSSQVFKELKFQLNKIAPDNVGEISRKCKSLMVQDGKDVTLLEKLAELVIEKFCIEPSYRGIYTQLCKEFCSDERLS